MCSTDTSRRINVKNMKITRILPANCIQTIPKRIYTAIFTCFLNRINTQGTSCPKRLKITKSVPRNKGTDQE
ncbi:hypothetical protein BpHYR1_014061 [Brachionus plicatilis]|uniref:Uncharacterized protein n=1 Tax=Brachionus plicatilis TaxID=10195 RepID=A0A3M7T6G5_BRAPC|nr:hypothetical protein BpHYR1_014061 [Brachionus plicatilis]